MVMHLSFRLRTTLGHILVISTPATLHCVHMQSPLRAHCSKAGSCRCGASPTAGGQRVFWPCRRLPHCRILANDLLKEALNPGSFQSVKGGQGLSVIAPDELAVLQAMMSQQDVSELQEAAGHDTSFNNLLGDVFGDPLQSEWVTCVLPGRGAFCQGPHRLYVLSRLGEMRLATTIVAEA